MRLRNRPCGAEDENAAHTLNNQTISETIEALRLLPIKYLGLVKFDKAREVNELQVDDNNADPYVNI